MSEGGFAAAGAVEAARSACDLNLHELMRRPDVTAIGVGERVVGGVNTHEICVKIFVPRKIPVRYLEPKRILPRDLAASRGRHSRVDVGEMDPPSSPPRALGVIRHTEEAAALWPLHGRAVPLAGRSGAHLQAGLGTIGMFAASRSGGGALFLSCNHVLADSNRGRIGTPILQPSFLDGGRYPGDWVGRLARYVPLRFGPAQTNTVDAALGRLLYDREVPNQIEGIGRIVGVAPAAEVRVGQTVFRKVGRTTGLTAGAVLAVHATLKIDYWTIGPLGRDTVFRDQIITTPMGDIGDSGSIAVDQRNHAAGLLFAGSRTHTFFNYLDRVVRLLRFAI